ncbi:MAG: hypothetical protein ACREFK_17180 [Stellaceae bacterium]
MAEPAGTFHPLSLALERIIATGCVVLDLSGEFVGPDGPMRIRYARNPVTNTFYVFDDFAENDLLAPSTVANIERRLGIDLKLPP